MYFNQNTYKTPAKEEEFKTFGKNESVGPFE